MNDIIKGALELRDKQGNFNKHYFETSADMVKFSDTTVADVLNNLSVTTADYADEAGSAEKDSAGNKITDYYAPINSPAFTGTPTAPTYTGTDTTVNQLCTCDYFNGLVRQVAGNVDSDMTLAKLITSINKDPNFATKMAIALDGKQDTTPALESIIDQFENGTFTANSMLYTADSETFVATPITPYGKKLLAAQSKEEFNRLLQAEAPTFYDESDKTMWKPVGAPFKTATNAKFGNALGVNASSSLQTVLAVEIGGQPFTIQFWAYGNMPPADQTDYTIFRVGGIMLDLHRAGGGNQPLYLRLTGASQSTFTSAVDTRAVKHYEIGYNNGSLMFFLDGIKRATLEVTLGRTLRFITLGGAIGTWFSEFRILDGVCAHTAAFTPPTEKYSVTDETISLLHFD